MKLQTRKVQLISVINNLRKGLKVPHFIMELFHSCRLVQFGFRLVNYFAAFSGDRLIVVTRAH